VLNHLSELKKVVLILGELSVKNVILLTDDYEIPWSLACFRSGADFRFLSSEYPCGTLLVDDTDFALSRLRNHHNLNRSQLLDVSGRKKGVCIVCGDLGGGERHSSLAFDYAQSLAEFFRADRTCDFEVECLGPNDWRQHARGTRELIGWLNEAFQHAKIIHYVGHVKDGFLWFDDRTKISAQALTVSLTPLDSRPLVVLQACESASFAADEDAGSHLCKVFLEKGASGCLAPVLPISIPTRLERFSETLIALFYRNIIENIPYGRSLANAQNEHQKRWDGDPQGFFFQLFGDPRAVWRPSAGAPSHLALMVRAIEAGRIPENSEMQMRVYCEGIDLPEAQIAAELASVLNNSPQIASYQQLPGTRALGLAETIVEAGPHMIFALNALWDIGGKEALKTFLTGVAGGFATKLLEIIPRGKGPKKDGQVGKTTERPKKPKGASGVREEQSWTIKIEVGKMKIQVGLKNGEVEIKAIGSGEVGQVA
jgi:hypothetical protein